MMHRGRPIFPKDKSGIKLNNKSVIKNVFWLLKRIWTYAPFYLFYVIVLGILWGVMQSINMIYIKSLLDALSNGSDFKTVLSIILAFGLYLVTFYILHHWYFDVKQPVYNEKLLIGINSELFKKAVELDLDRYDDPAFYNDFIWAMDQSFTRSMLLMVDTRNMIRCFVAATTISAVLFSVDTLIAVVVFAISVIRVVFTLLQNRINLKFFEEINPLNRKDGYINRVFMLPDYAKDLRVSRVTELLNKEFSCNTEEKNKVVKKFAKKRTIYLFLSQSIPTVGEISIYIIMAYKILVTKTMGVGDLAIAVSSIWRLSWQLRDFVDKIMRFHEHGIYIEKIIRFKNCEPKIINGTLEADDFKTLEIKDLCFSYHKDKQEIKALKNVNLSISKGEKIAIVGYNGAGKTTLTKLIMRLYEQQSGNILYNGKPLNHYNIKSLRQRCAAVFQDYRIFASTVAENVVGGEVKAEDRVRVEEVLFKSAFGTKLKSLTKGIDTVITREFDDEGINLSGGEQQKVAIARAFYKDSDLIILDEPSSALDPDAEYNLNRAISEYAKDKTVIFISHRLSTTRHADRIYMFDNGEIVESGSHDELIKLGGKYAYMFNLQAENYKS